MKMQHVHTNWDENGTGGLVNTVCDAAGDYVRVKDEHTTMNLHDESGRV